MTKILTGKRVTLLIVVVLCMLTAYMQAEPINHAGTNDKGISASSLHYSPSGATQSTAWFFSGAYVNYSLVYIYSGGKTTAYSRETVVSVSPDGSFELKILSSYGGYLNVQYENLTLNSLTDGGLFLNGSELTALNDGSNISSSTFGTSHYTVQVGYKFTDSMGTFTTDKVTAILPGELVTAYIDQKAGIAVGLSVVTNGSGSTLSGDVYGNLTSTNIPTTLSPASANSYILYLIIGGVSAAVVVAVVAYFVMSRKKITPPPEIKQ